MAAQQKHQSWLSSVNDKGEFVRKETQFRNWISADGKSGFPAAVGRYHLYVSLACPWAHRCLILLKLKGLEKVITHTVVDWLLGEGGWKFCNDKPKCELDTVNNCTYLREVYLKANPNYVGNITVPCLWDKVNKTIVSNESAEIITMLNKEFNEFCATTDQKKLDFYPENLRDEINRINDIVYPNINNGVYRCGFSTSQEAYDNAVKTLFEHLDWLEGHLKGKTYLVGEQLTLSDVRLFTTLIRFDWVYHQHFKTNKKRIVDYPNIWAYTKRIYNNPWGIKETVDKEHIMKHYMVSHRSINPHGIVSVGPDLDFDN